MTISANSSLGNFELRRRLQKNKCADCGASLKRGYQPRGDKLVCAGGCRR